MELITAAHKHFPIRARHITAAQYQHGLIICNLALILTPCPCPRIRPSRGRWCSLGKQLQEPVSCSVLFLVRSSGGMLCRSLHGRSPIHRLGACLSGPGHRLLTTGRVSPYKSGPVDTLSRELCAKANMCQRCRGGLIDLPGFAAFFAPLQYDLNDESPSPVTFEDVSTAMFRIRNGIKRTPCNRSHFLSELCGTSIYLKNEFSQFTGSFKVIFLNAARKLFGLSCGSARNI